MPIPPASVRIAMLFVIGCAAVTAAQTSEMKSPTATGPKEKYCVDSGGIVETRHAVYGTNNPYRTWLPLAGVEGFCQYTLPEDGSRISKIGRASCRERV